MHVEEWRAGKLDLDRTSLDFLIWRAGQKRKRRTTSHHFHHGLCVTYSLLRDALTLSLSDDASRSRFQFQIPIPITITISVPIALPIPITITISVPIALPLPLPLPLHTTNPLHATRAPPTTLRLGLPPRSAKRSSAMRRKRWKQRPQSPQRLLRDDRRDRPSILMMMGRV